MKVLIDLPVLEAGYKYIGQYRQAKEGEHYLNTVGKIKFCDDIHTAACYLIVEKIIKWRTAEMPKDYGKKCRVRDRDIQNWKTDILCGYKGAGTEYYGEYPYLCALENYKCCEVLDE